MYKVAVILAEGFEEVEAIAPVDLLRRAKIECVTVSLAREKLVPSSRNIPVMADRSCPAAWPGPSACWQTSGWRRC